MNLKISIILVVVLALFSAQAYTDNCVNLGNYVRGSSPVVGGYVASADIVGQFEKGLTIPYADDSAAFPQMPNTQSTKVRMPEWNADTYSYKWAKRLDPTKVAITQWPDSGVFGQLYPYPIATNFTPVSPYSEVVLPRAFGQICTGTDSGNTYFVSSWIGTQFQYYMKPSCPPNTAPIQVQGYTTNDGKSYAAGSRYIPPTFFPPSSLYMASMQRYSCPAGSTLTTLPTPLNYGCRLDNSIEVTVCVVTDTTE